MRRRVKWILLVVVLLAVALFAAFCFTHDMEMLLDVSRAPQPDSENQRTPS